MDRDLRLLGLFAMGAAINAKPKELGAYASGGSQKTNADLVPRGTFVSDPVFRDLLAESGADPDRLYYPPIGALPGEYTLNDLVAHYQQSSVQAVREWLPQGKGTDRGAVEVDLVNSFVDDFMPLVLEDGAQLTYSIGPAEKLLHDILDEQTEYPDEGGYEEQIAWCNAQLEIYMRGGGA